ncbi:hypothetical protein [Cellulosimicrobium sp. SL-1]|uniref:hypothetical protein n=1 Tax=Cellulosimicrobium sp. SL-1 TaxID=2699423 RepID=UPI0013D50849|nr:hypothetical protein [Cellulosimicrobium sp. SL-1]
MNEFLWLLWGFLALILGAALAVVAAYGSGVVAAVFDEARARQRLRSRRAWVRRELRTGSRRIARELDRAMPPSARRRGVGVAVVLEHPTARRPRTSELTALADATSEERGR